MKEPKLHKQETRRILQLAREYSEKGYEVTIRPTRLQLPDFLSPLSPDLLAVDNNEKVVIEVKHQDSLAKSLDLEKLAVAVNRHPGWRFELVVINPKPDKTLEQTQFLNGKDLQRRLRSITALIKAKDLDSAMVLVWASLEGALRLIAHVEGLQIDEMRTDQLLKKSLSLGLIGKNSYNTLNEGVHIRNAVVHGLKPKGVSRKFLQRAIRTFEDLIRRAKLKYDIKSSEVSGAPRNN